MNKSFSGKYELVGLMAILFTLGQLAGITNFEFKFNRHLLPLSFGTYFPNSTIVPLEKNSGFGAIVLCVCVCVIPNPAALRTRKKPIKTWCFITL